MRDSFHNLPSSHDPFCPKCGHGVRDRLVAFECEMCGCWEHAGCAGFGERFTEIFTELCEESRSHFHYECSACRQRSVFNLNLNIGKFFRQKIPPSSMDFVSGLHFCSNSSENHVGSCSNHVGNQDVCESAGNEFTLVPDADDSDTSVHTACTSPTRDPSSSRMTMDVINAGISNLMPAARSSSDLTSSESGQSVTPTNPKQENVYFELPIDVADTIWEISTASELAEFCKSLEAFVCLNQSENSSEPVLLAFGMKWNSHEVDDNGTEHNLKNKHRRTALIQFAFGNRLCLIDMFALRNAKNVDWPSFFSVAFYDNRFQRIGCDVSPHCQYFVVLKRSLRMFEPGKVSNVVCLQELMSELADSESFLEHLRTYPYNAHLTNAPYKKRQGPDGLVELLLGKTLDRPAYIEASNWEERPLSLAQKQCAGIDVYCLLEIYAKMCEFEQFREIFLRCGFKATGPGREGRSAELRARAFTAPCSTTRSKTVSRDNVPHPSSGTDPMRLCVQSAFEKLKPAERRFLPTTSIFDPNSKDSKNAGIVKVNATFKPRDLKILIDSVLRDLSKHLRKCGFHVVTVCRAGPEQFLDLAKFVIIVADLIGCNNILLASKREAVELAERDGIPCFYVDKELDPLAQLLSVLQNVRVSPTLDDMVLGRCHISACNAERTEVPQNEIELLWRKKMVKHHKDSTCTTSHHSFVLNSPPNPTTVVDLSTGRIRETGSLLKLGGINEQTVREATRFVACKKCGWVDSYENEQKLCDAYARKLHSAFEKILSAST